MNSCIFYWHSFVKKYWYKKHDIYFIYIKSYLSIDLKNKNVFANNNSFRLFVKVFLSLILFLLIFITFDLFYIMPYFYVFRKMIYVYGYLLKPKDIIAEVILFINWIKNKEKLKDLLEVCIIWSRLSLLIYFWHHITCQYNYYNEFVISKTININFL